MLAGLPNSERYEAEKSLIGRIILANGAIEMAMATLLRAVFGGDTGKAIRVLYRISSAAVRRDVLDALCRQVMVEYEMIGEFQHGMDSVKHCAKIRNQYAHGTFQERDGILHFSNLDDWASKRSAPLKMIMNPISVETLQSQLSYIEYTLDYMDWLSEKFLARARQIPSKGSHSQKPKQVSPPNLHSRISR